MSERRLPPEIMAYLGPCREPNGLVEKVIEQCGLGKIMGDAGLTDFDPLVVALYLVTEEIAGLGRSLKTPNVRKAWCEIVRRIQEGEAYLEHNVFIPCRYCDKAFEPVIDERLLTLFLAWYESCDLANLLAFHRCPECGGQLGAKQTKKYDGDMHTPEPGSVASDVEWAELLLQHSGL